MREIESDFSITGTIIRGPPLLKNKLWKKKQNPFIVGGSGGQETMFTRLEIDVNPVFNKSDSEIVDQLRREITILDSLVLVNARDKDNQMHDG